MSLPFLSGIIAFTKSHSVRNILLRWCMMSILGIPKQAKLSIPVSSKKAWNGKVLEQRLIMRQPLIRQSYHSAKDEYTRGIPRHTLHWGKNLSMTQLGWPAFLGPSSAVPVIRSIISNSKTVHPQWWITGMSYLTMEGQWRQIARNTTIGNRNLHCLIL